MELEVLLKILEHGYINIYLNHLLEVLSQLLVFIVHQK